GAEAVNCPLEVFFLQVSHDAPSSMPLRRVIASSERRRGSGCVPKMRGSSALEAIGVGGRARWLHSLCLSLRPTFESKQLTSTHPRQLPRRRPYRAGANGRDRLSSSAPSRGDYRRAKHRAAGRARTLVAKLERARHWWRQGPL